MPKVLGISPTQPSPTNPLFKRHAPITLISSSGLMSDDGTLLRSEEQEVSFVTLAHSFLDLAPDIELHISGAPVQRPTPGRILRRKPTQNFAEPTRERHGRLAFQGQQGDGAQ